jgi:hypothetical protein
MNNDQILTCHQCDYHLQDKDLSGNSIFTNEQINHLQNYQNKKVLESYNNLYGAEDALNINPPIPQQQTNGPTTSNGDIPRRKCDLCSKQHPYEDIFLLSCDCKICYDCFAIDVNRQRTTINEVLSSYFLYFLYKRNEKEILFSLFAVSEPNKT